MGFDDKESTDKHDTKQEKSFKGYHPTSERKTILIFISFRFVSIPLDLYHTLLLTEHRHDRE